MKLDLSHKSLSFSINDGEWIVIDDIKVSFNTKYKLAIFLGLTDDSVQLLSYDNIDHDEDEEEELKKEYEDDDVDQLVRKLQITGIMPKVSGDGNNNYKNENNGKLSFSMQQNNMITMGRDSLSKSKSKGSPLQKIASPRAFNGRNENGKEKENGNGPPILSLAEDRQSRDGKSVNLLYQSSPEPSPVPIINGSVFPQRAPMFGQHSSSQQQISHHQMQIQHLMEALKMKSSELEALQQQCSNYLTDKQLLEQRLAQLQQSQHRSQVCFFKWILCNMDK